MLCCCAVCCCAVVVYLQRAPFDIELVLGGVGVVHEEMGIQDSKASLPTLVRAALLVDIASVERGGEQLGESESAVRHCIGTETKQQTLFLVTLQEGVSVARSG